MASIIILHLNPLSFHEAVQRKAWESCEVVDDFSSYIAYFRG